MKKEKSLWDRVNENPILPGLLLGFWIWKMNQPNWNWGWWQIAGVGIVAVWFLWTLLDFLLGGKLTDWIESESDSSFSIPDSFPEFEKKSKLSTPLIDALREGLKDGGDMEGLIEEAAIESIEDVDEAIGVLTAYKILCDSDDSRAADVMGLFRSAGDSDVFAVFYQKGMPLVHERWKLVKDRDSDELDLRDERLNLLAMLVGFGYVAAFDDIKEAAKDSRINESYMWGTIFGAGNEGDEDFIDLMKILGKDIPTGFAGVAFLDRCNELCLEHDQDFHPFSNDAGIERLMVYLADPDPEHFSYANSASTAIPFISHPRANEVLALAMKHPDSNASVEAAWAGAKLEDFSAIERLKQLAEDWKTGSRAMRFLRELKLEDEIPEECLEFRHVALCEMADWLQHPNELGRMPDQVEIKDSRRIFWPPSEEERDVALVKWISGEDFGIGLTGGTTTWCFFSTENQDEPVIDLYSRHCNWEMRANEMDGAPDEYNDLEFGRDILRKVNPEEMWES